MGTIDTVEHFSKVAKEGYVTANNRRYHEYRFKAFNNLLPSQPKSLKIFDFGCGTADNIITLSKAGHTLAGCDPSAEMITAAASKLKTAGIDPKVVHVGGVEAMADEKSGTYDVVMSQDVLPYMTDAEEDDFYKQARRIIKDTGVVIVSYVNPWVDLITFNRYTVEFWAENILPSVTKSAQERDELLQVLKSHITNPAIPVKGKDVVSEKDIFGQSRKRKDPISCQRDIEKKGFKVDSVEFTHYFPMPPQYIENSEKYSKYVYEFEDAIRAQGNPIGYVLASIYYVRMKKA